MFNVKTKLILVIFYFFNFCLWGQENNLKIDDNGIYYWHQKIEEKAPKEIKIIFISDIHSSIHKWPHIVNFFNEINKTGDNTVENWVMLGGDYIIGEGDFDLRDAGEINYRLISKTKNIVAAAIGNHDIENLNMVDPFDMAEKYNMPLISSNVVDINDGNLAYPGYVLREYKDKTFLFLSFVDDGPNNNIKFSEKMNIEDPVQAYKKILPLIIKEHKVDELILNNHLGSSDLSKIIKTTKAVNIVFNGHMHSPKLEHQENRINRQVTVIGGGYRASNLQVIKIRYNPNLNSYQYVYDSYKNISSKKFIRDYNTVHEINDFIENNPLPEKYEYLEDKLFKYKAKNPKEKFSSDRYYLGDRTKVNAPFPNLVNDAIRRASGASVSFFNADGLRKNIKQRPETSYMVSGMDIYNAIPFENNIYYAYMSGEQISVLTDKVIHLFPFNRRGYFTGVLGTNTEKQFYAKKIWDPTLKRYDPIDPNREYKVAFTNFYGEEHPIFKNFLLNNNIRYYKTNLIDHLVVIDYIKHLEETEPTKWTRDYHQKLNNYEKQGDEYIIYPKTEDPLKEPDYKDKTIPIISEEEALEIICDYTETTNTDINYLKKLAFNKIAKKQGYLDDEDVRFLFGKTGNSGFFNYMITNAKTEEDLYEVIMISFLSYDQRNFFTVKTSCSESINNFISEIIESVVIPDFKSTNTYVVDLVDKKEICNNFKNTSNALYKQRYEIRTPKTHSLRFR
jgi:2',3'-cyclic-nucleotide 2'-phosphodiesterase (5'-nucleotidase family)